MKVGDWPGAAVAGVWLACGAGFLLLLGALEPQESHLARGIVLLASLAAAGLPIAVTWRWLRGRSEEGGR